MKRIENIFVSFEQAEKLKELGFDGETSAYYSTLHGKRELKNLSYFGRWNTGTGSGTMTAAPTVAQALRWFRREKGITVFIIDMDKQGIIYKETKFGYQIKGLYPAPGYWNTYEDAEHAALTGVIGFLEAEMALMRN